MAVAAAMEATTEVVATAMVAAAMGLAAVMISQRFFVRSARSLTILPLSAISILTLHSPRRRVQALYPTPPTVLTPTGMSTLAPTTTSLANWTSSLLRLELALVFLEEERVMQQ